MIDKNLFIFYQMRQDVKKIRWNFIYITNLILDIMNIELIKYWKNLCICFRYNLKILVSVWENE